MTAPGRRRFGPSGRAVPAVGQGTWAMEHDPGAAVAALRTGLELGLTLIDTAEMYGDGRVEQIVGEALEGRREQAFLVSKVLPANATRAGVVAACERSLRRLRTDHLDLYLLHWASPHPLEETVAGFEALRARGDIAAWGVSNFDRDELDQVLALAPPGAVVTDQVLYHVKQRAIEHALLPACAEHGLALMAYSPLGQGDFPSPGEAGRDVLDGVAAAHGADAWQVALAFLLRHPEVVVIPKASTLEHVRANAGALELELEPEEIDAIDRAFPRGPEPPSLPAL